MATVTVEPEWIGPTYDSATASGLADSLGCSPVLAAVLASRDLTDPTAAERALDPAVGAINRPAALPDIDAAVDRLQAAVDRRDAVAVFADRDVDGITGCAILATLLREFDVPTTVRVPGKWDGYGLGEDAVQALVKDGVDLLVTVDCGTTAHGAIDQARSAGADVIVIDHHDPDESLPDATACVNPRRPDSRYPNAHLAGGALAWKVGQALVEAVDPLRIETYHRRALPLAAVATLGDYMSLTLENRAIVREGFARLPECDLAGLRAAAAHCEVGSIRDVRWSLVPLLNAAQEAESGELMVDVLLASDDDRIDALLDRLEDYRAKRRTDRAERLAHLEACVDEQVDPADGPVIFVETDRWVGGGPMSELSGRWHKPVVTYRPADAGFKGGGRTAPDVDLLALYEACEDLLEEYWGHPGAAGFRIAGESLEPFRHRLTAALRSRHDPDDLRPTIAVDAIVDPTEVDATTVEELHRFGPFGPAHDEPTVLVEAVAIDDWERFGDDAEHWKGWPTGTDDLAVLYWDGADAMAQSADPLVCDFVGTLGMDSYEQTPALTVVDHREASNT